VLACVLLSGRAAVAGEVDRYGVAADLKGYRQGSAREVLASAIKAVEAGRVDYLLAQLTDPAWLDDRVARLYGGRFAEQVQETRARLDPAAVKLLRRILDRGEWSAGRDRESVRLKDQDDRAVFFVRHGDRWYVENRSKPDA
jgi:hypothetical protein